MNVNIISYCIIELNNDKGKFSEQIEAIVKNTKVDVHTDQRMLELLRICHFTVRTINGAA